MSVEFLLDVGDGLGTIIVGAFVALVRSWNSGYLRHYLDGRGQETEECEDDQNDFENLVERVDSMEERIDRLNGKIDAIVSIETVHDTEPPSDLFNAVYCPFYVGTYSQHESVICARGRCDSLRYRHRRRQLRRLIRSEELRQDCDEPPRGVRSRT